MPLPAPLRFVQDFLGLTWSSMPHRRDRPHGWPCELFGAVFWFYCLVDLPL